MPSIVRQAGTAKQRQVRPIFAYQLAAARPRRSAQARRFDWETGYLIRLFPHPLLLY